MSPIVHAPATRVKLLFMRTDNYRIQYVDANGVHRDTGPYELSQAQLQLQAAVQSGARQGVILRDYEDRELARGRFDPDGEY